MKIDTIRSITWVGILLWVVVFWVAVINWVIE